MWFSIPQDVTDGFNVWFEFKLTPGLRQAKPTAWPLLSKTRPATDPTAPLDALNPAQATQP